LARLVSARAEIGAQSESAHVIKIRTAMKRRKVLCNCISVFSELAD
jgi:hypothetical protein